MSEEHEGGVAAPAEEAPATSPGSPAAEGAPRKTSVHFKVEDLAPRDPEGAAGDGPTPPSPARVTKREVALSMRRVHKAYGRGAMILNDLNMTVYKGSIYGLLGSSGCGKTTLLRCAVGLLKLNHGEVMVFGGRPGTRGSGVPGARVGYMPQDVALVTEFTVKAVIYYFGWLFGMKDSEIKERYTFLKQLLQLPSGGRFIKNLSGGQQRRVSFAAALVQSPELLILDEPTVGLDPVLRQAIWDYLVEISRNQGTTILITTHYIEEAKQADMIGMLRGGTLLAEESPSSLLSLHGTTSLEQVFLTLSQKQAYGEVEGPQVMVVDDKGEAEMVPDQQSKQEIPLVELSSQPVYQRKPPVYRKSHIIPIKALLYKNFTKILNTYGGLFFLFIFPLVEVSIVFAAVGRDPRGLTVGVVNDELGNCDRLPGDPELYSGVRLPDDDDDFCHLFGLSCPFIDAMDDGTVTKHVYYEDFEDALAASRAGTTIGTIRIPSNFSLFLQERVRDGKDASPEAVDKSAVSIWLDMSDFTGLSVKRHVYRSYQVFADMLTSSCKLPMKLAHIPIQFETPVYGSEDQAYIYFLAPGLIVSMVFFLCTTMTISIVAMDRAEQSWDRNLVAGVTATKIVVSHVVAQSVCLVVMMTEIISLAYLVFGMSCKGDFGLMLFLVFLQGLNGVGFGMVVSVASKNLTAAAYIGMGSFYPAILTSGMLWPLEGMPHPLRIVSECLPNTWATTSLRNIVDHGWGLTHPQVYPGFLISGGWIIFQAILCILFLRIAK